VLSSLVDAERRGRQAGSRGVKLTWRSLGQISLALTWSTQTLARTWERQERYRGDGVRSCWFFRNPPSGSEAPDKECPMFPLELIDVDNEEYAVMIGGRRVSLGQGVEDLLTGKVRFRQEVAVLWWEEACLTFVPARCPRCAEESYVHAAAVTWRRPHYSPCGWLVYPSPGPESGIVAGVEAIEREDVAALVEQFFATEGAELRASPYKRWEVRREPAPVAPPPPHIEQDVQPEPETEKGTKAVGFLGRLGRLFAWVHGGTPSPPVAPASSPGVIRLPAASPPPPLPPLLVTAFGCPACEITFGAAVVDDALTTAARTGVTRTIKSPLTTPQRISRARPHWCYPGDGQFCVTVDADNDEL